MGYGIHENAVHPHAAIEFASSTLVGFRRESSALIVDLKAYVHRSRDIPGIDPGSVWDQDVSIVLENAQLPDLELSPVGTIEYGSVTAGGLIYEWLVPCPLLCGQGVILELRIASGPHLSIEADGIAIQFAGEERYLWDFTGD